MKLEKKIFQALPLLIFLLAGSGCALAVVGGVGAGGAYVWEKGKLTTYIKAPLGAVYESALNSANAFFKSVIEKKLTDHYGTLEGVMLAGGDEAHIYMERWTDTETRVTVRVGLYKNKKAETILRDMESRIGEQ
jgi:hypothetical protein